MGLFVTIRSLLLVFTLYFAFIINNSFSQLFQSQIVLSTFLLSFIIAELLSNAYKLVFSNLPGLQIYGFNLVLASLILLEFPLLLNYFLIFVVFLFYNYFIIFLSIFFTVEDFSTIIWSSKNINDENYKLSERKGLFYSYYVLELFVPLNFLTKDDKKNYFDLIKSKEAKISYSVTLECNFSFNAKGCKYFSTTKRKLIKLATDIDQMSKNILIE